MLIWQVPTDNLVGSLTSSWRIVATCCVDKWRNSERPKSHHKLKDNVLLTLWKLNTRLQTKLYILKKKCWNWSQKAAFSRDLWRVNLLESRLTNLLYKLILQYRVPTWETAIKKLWQRDKKSTTIVVNQISIKVKINKKSSSSSYLKINNQVYLPSQSRDYKLLPQTVKPPHSMWKKPTPATYSLQTIDCSTSHSSC